MLTSIERKIEEIRRKPENVRMRYAFVMVAFAMIAVLGIWIVGLKESLKDGAETDAGVMREVFSDESVPSPAPITGQEELSLEEVFGAEGAE